MIEVVAQMTWRVHAGTIEGVGGLDGQLTWCRIGDREFYVRENIRVDHFNVSGNERWGMKIGTSPIKRPQVLELACVSGCWTWTAEMVHACDAMGRPVRKNRLFTADWARRQFWKIHFRKK